MDRAGRVYWEQYWKNTSLPEFAEASDRGLNHYVNRRFKEYFHATFRDVTTSGQTLLEIGCARSIWLSYFAKAFRRAFEVSPTEFRQSGLFAGP